MKYWLKSRQALEDERAAILERALKVERSLGEQLEAEKEKKRDAIFRCEKATKEAIRLCGKLEERQREIERLKNDLASEVRQRDALVGAAERSKEEAAYWKRRLELLLEAVSGVLAANAGGQKGTCPKVSIAERDSRE